MSAFDELPDACDVRVLVVSPHLDDAALGCAGPLTAAREAFVCNVFTGFPAPSLPLTPWDASCGFASGAQAMQARLEEDGRALQILGACGRHLGFLDSQYAPLPERKRVAEAIVDAIDAIAPEVVLIPMGLHHCDHERVHEAALLARRKRASLVWLGYEDLPYRRRRGVLQARLVALAHDAIQATPVTWVQTDLEVKARAVAAYASQLRAIEASSRDEPDGGRAAVEHERFWLLEPTPGQPGPGVSTAQRQIT